ncbi:MAG: DUF1778 domain-containing protein [Actinomycetota bacterium]|nr:DUF1778 domain-containing protein [Actinomycetota bacterium]
MSRSPQIRVGPGDKALLERAAAASHLNVSAFVFQAAASRAEEIPADRSSIRLLREATVAFTEALERPAEVNDRLASDMWQAFVQLAWLSEMR